MHSTSRCWECGCTHQPSNQVCPGEWIQAMYLVCRTILLHEQVLNHTQDPANQG